MGSATAVILDPVARASAALVHTCTVSKNNLPEELSIGRANFQISRKHRAPILLAASPALARREYTLNEVDMSSHFDHQKCFLQITVNQFFESFLINFDFNTNIQQIESKIMFQQPTKQAPRTVHTPGLSAGMPRTPG